MYDEICAEGPNNENLTENSGKHKGDYKWKFVWNKILILMYVHLASIYGLYLGFFYAKHWTIIWGKYFLSILLLSTLYLKES